MQDFTPMPMIEPDLLEQLLKEEIAAMREEKQSLWDAGATVGNVKVMILEYHIRSYERMLERLAERKKR